jgi:hypothetical protein
MGQALVDYGLGNFVWYGTSELSTETGVLLVTVDGRRSRGTAGSRAASSTAPRGRSPEPSVARDLVVEATPELHGLKP